MIISAIDDRHDLFSVEQVVNQDLISWFNNEDIDSYEWVAQEWQEQLPRRKLLPHQGSAVEAMIQQLSELPQQINNIIGTDFKDIDASCWYDLAGFKQDIHIDNSNVKSVLHFFIGTADRDHGTVWYQVEDNDVEERNDSQKWYLQNHNLSIRHTFDFIPNTGYIQLNNKRQAHAPAVSVRENQKRVSFYCYLL